MGFKASSYAPLDRLIGRGIVFCGKASAPPAHVRANSPGDAVRGNRLRKHRPANASLHEPHVRVEAEPHECQRLHGVPLAKHCVDRSPRPPISVHFCCPLQGRSTTDVTGPAGPRAAAAAIPTAAPVTRPSTSRADSRVPAPPDRADEDSCCRPGTPRPCLGAPAPR